jgi:hypothetical protein
MVMLLTINKELWTAETVLETRSEMGGNNVTTLSWSFEMRDGKQESRSMGLAECIEANRRLKEKEAVIRYLGTVEE